MELEGVRKMGGKYYLYHGLISIEGATLTLKKNGKKIELPPGMIAFAPVFKDKKKAEEWAKGTYGLEAIREIKAEK